MLLQWTLIANFNLESEIYLQSSVICSRQYKNIWSLSRFRRWSYKLFSLKCRIFGMYRKSNIIKKVLDIRLHFRISGPTLCSFNDRIIEWGNSGKKPTHGLVRSKAFVNMRGHYYAQSRRHQNQNVISSDHGNTHQKERDDYTLWSRRQKTADILPCVRLHRNSFGRDHFVR